MKLTKQHIPAIVARLLDAGESLNTAQADIHGNNFMTADSRLLFEVDAETYRNEIDFLTAELIRISNS